MDKLLWIVKIGGALIWFAFGLGILKIGSISRRKKDYTQYPTTSGTVSGTVGFHDNDWRQLMRFQTPDGTEVLAMHDLRNRKALPERGTVHPIYYWPVRQSSHYSHNCEDILYYFHYCDEQIYGGPREVPKHMPLVPLLLGCLCIGLGLYMLFFLNM